MKESLESRFWSKVERGPVDSCWMWSGARRMGYGAMKYDGRVLSAHRVSWVLDNGRDVPDGLYVCHRCDCRACVNPTHLFIGTHSDNMKDAALKGRLHVQTHKSDRNYAKGVRQYSSKLTDADVIEIRLALDAGEPQRVVARRFGVSQHTIWAINVGKLWTHVP